MHARSCGALPAAALQVPPGTVTPLGSAALVSQSKYFLTEAPTHAPLTPRVLAGAALWLAGWLTNLQADHILINLRKPGETGEGCSNSSLLGARCAGGQPDTP